jgi:4-hydroxy-2-oxoheptanedioate aldolase
MRENRLRKIWQEGGTAVNGWLHVPSSFSAEVMAHSGWDSLTIDMQHGPVDYGSLVPMLQAISTTDTVPVVRVPWNDPGLIMRVLDAGCYAVICPMINTREEAEAFVGACRYPPEGYRSYGPYRATLYGGQDYTDHANETVVTMAMIETQQALENLDEILGVNGLDAIFVGPSDLGQSPSWSKLSKGCWPPHVSTVWPPVSSQVLRSTPRAWQGRVSSSSPSLRTRGSWPRRRPAP